MRDIPFFATEFGVASLTLSQIPYTHRAYIRIQSTSSAVAFLEECVGFCCAAGAVHVYSTGHEVCQRYPVYTSIVKMQADKHMMGQTDVMLFPVTEKNVSEWVEIYNKKSLNIPNSAWMDSLSKDKILAEGDGYFIHNNGKLLGTGKASNGKIHWICSVSPGAGKDILCALASTLPGDTVSLEVASSNHKAIALYKALGFIPIEELVCWYCVK